MKRKILFLIAVMAMVACFMALGASAATTNEFGQAEALSNINLTNMNADTQARVVIVNANGEYHTYPTSYILTNSTTLAFNFSPITNALGETISKASIVRIEVPSNITNIAYAGLAQCAKLVEIKFFDDSALATVGGGGFYANPCLEKIYLPASLQEFTGTQIFNECPALHTVIFAENSQITTIPEYCFQNCTSLKKLVLPHSVTTLGKRLFDSATVIEELYLSPNLVDFGKEHFAWKQSGSLKIFAPAQLFENKETVGIVDFSWWENDKCLPSMAIFITGTKDQADAIVAKSTYHKLTNATVSKWDPSNTTDSYLPASGWAIVYDYGVCDAFYGGKHQLTGESTANVIDFFTEIKVGDLCTRKGCGAGTTEKTIAPIFENLGFSTSEIPDVTGKSSITLGYKINYDAYEEYLEYGTFEFGLVLSAVEVVGNEPLVIENGQVVKASQRVLTVKQSELICDYVDFKLIGIDSSFNGKELIMSMYTYNGSEIDYLNENVTIQVK